MGTYFAGYRKVEWIYLGQQEVEFRLKYVKLLSADVGDLQPEVGIAAHVQARSSGAWSMAGVGRRGCRRGVLTSKSISEII